MKGLLDKVIASNAEVEVYINVAKQEGCSLVPAIAAEDELLTTY